MGTPKIFVKFLTLLIIEIKIYHSFAIVMKQNRLHNTICKMNWKFSKA